MSEKYWLDKMKENPRYREIWEKIKEQPFHETTEIILDLEAKLAESESESNARYSAWQEEIGECDRLRVALAEKNELFIATKWKVDDLKKQLAELIKEKQKDLTIKEILIELMKADTDNCEVKFKSGDLEFTLDITITKIVKCDVVEYDASEEKADE